MGICKTFLQLICHGVRLSRADNVITLLCSAETQITKLCVKTQAQTEAAKPGSGFCSISDTAAAGDKVRVYHYLLWPVILSGELSA